MAGALLARGGWRGLAAVASSRLLHQLDRVGPQAAAEGPQPPGPAADAQYLAHAAAALREEVAAALPPMLARLGAALQAPGAGGAGQGGAPATLQLETLQNLLGSAALRGSLVTGGRGVGGWEGDQQAFVGPCAAG